MTSLIERTSRFTFLLPNQDKRSAAVVAGIADALRGLPEDARRTVTFDRGSEFAGYAALDRDLAVKAYFCDPHSPWQKGAVENANGRVRRFLPRHCEPEALARPPSTGSPTGSTTRRGAASATAPRARSSSSTWRPRPGRPNLTPAPVALRVEIAAGKQPRPAPQSSAHAGTRELFGG